jgi:AcrR family transcriptional regulator
MITRRDSTIRARALPLSRYANRAGAAPRSPQQQVPPPCRNTFRAFVLDFGARMSDISTEMIERSKNTETARSAVRGDAILSAAQRLFAHYGFAKVSMDDIARDVGMAKASLYYYFATKEDLFRAVIGREQEEFVAAVTAEVERDIPSARKLHAYVEKRFAYFRKVANLSKLSYQSLVEMKPLFGTLHHDFAERELALIRRILREGKRRGEFRIGAVNAHATLFLHAIQGLRLRMFRDIERARPDETGAMVDALEGEMRLVARIFVDAYSMPPDPQKPTPAEAAAPRTRGGSRRIH